MTKKSGVYKITNLINNKIYLGSSSDLRSRKKSHLFLLRNNNHPNKHLQNSYNRYGDNNFKWEIIEYVEFNENKEILKKNLLEREQHWIDELKVCDKKYGYNIRTLAESNIGFKHSKETIYKFRNRKPTEETRTKLGNSRRGRKHTEESKQKISKSNKGKKRSDETIIKMKESWVGRTISKETRIKMKNSLKDRIFSEEHRRKLKENHAKLSGINNSKSRKVINLSTNKIFDSVSEASKFYKIFSSGISRACNGIQKTSAGFRWSYVIEDNQDG